MKTFLRDTEINPADPVSAKNSLILFLQDIDKIFDISVSSADRHLTASTIEVYLGIFLDYYLKTVINNIKNNNKLSFTQELKLYSLRGKFNRQVYHYVDFLSAVASSKNSKKMSLYKYETMETLLTFLSHFEKLKNLSESHHVDIPLFIKDFSNYLQKIQTLSLGIEKRSRFFSLVPFKKPIPSCQKLVRMK